jgi:hypothetical protein
LAIDPGHKGALNYFNKLDKAQAGTKPPSPEKSSLAEQSPGAASSKKDSPLIGVFGLILDWFASLPSGCVFIAIFAGIIAGVFIYTSVNTSLFGLAGSDFDNLVISNSYELISSDDIYWKVQFEGIGDSKYIGTVRHVSPIRIEEFAILTHDILVTTGDFANPDIVSTNVIDHKFFWKSQNASSPSGSINLIHALPANKSIYQQLLDIHKWDTVRITGREIFTINAYQVDETLLGTWLDTGCNTLLVESVTIIKGTE